MSATANIMDRIRKLMALADHESGGTEAERTLAAQRAQELMFKHQLDLAAVDAHVSQDDILRHEETIKGVDNQWRGTFLGFVGMACGCTTFVTKQARNLSTVSVVGRKENVELSRAIYNSLADWLAIESTHAYKHESELSLIHGDHVPRPKSFRRAFFASASSRIYSRLNAKRQSMENESGSTGMELVRNEQAANDQWLVNHGITLRKGRQRSYKDMSGAMAGRSAGDRASLEVQRNVNRHTRRELNA